MLDVRQLGTVAYPEAWDLQKRLVAERAAGRIPDTLLLLEHPHVITCGRGFRERSLASTRHPVFHIERGGDVTYHGPGQLVGYPIVALRERGLTIGAWLRLLEDRLIAALAEFDLPGERLKGFTGVWCRGRKLASIGVAVRSWIAFHGFALNVTTDLAQAAGVYPCGLEPGQLSTMSEAAGRTIALGQARAAVARAFEARLGVGECPTLQML
ncbi:MAG: lipoyl(octanoyl) transferase LipB [Elusimicrobia bacterium]|nr:lipoyl(octanoyl) transferase LipB [Elusimicrobiota bacterium]